MRAIDPRQLSETVACAPREGLALAKNLKATFYGIHRLGHPTRAGCAISTRATGHLLASGSGADRIAALGNAIEQLKLLQDALVEDTSDLDVVYEVAVEGASVCDCGRTFHPQPLEEEGDELSEHCEQCFADLAEHEHFVRSHRHDAL